VIVRILNLVVIGALIMAAAYVYRIKYDSTVQAERLAKIRSEVRREREAIAALRAEWGEVQTPTRIEALTKRYLHLKPIAPTQFDKLNALPEQPPQLVKPDSRDPIGEVIENLEEPPATMTGSVWPPMAAPQAAAASADAMPDAVAPAAPVMAPPATPAPGLPVAPAPSAPAAAAPAAVTAPASTGATSARTPITKSGRLDR
jgi:cell division protein FtsL